MRIIRLAVFSMVTTLGAAAYSRAVGAAEAGQSAPEIQLKDFSGKDVALSRMKGKVIIVDFWASWCGPCRESMPVLDKLSKTYKDKGLVVLGVNIDNDAKTALKFLKEIPVSFAVVNDADKKVAKAYAPPTMPSSYIIDKQGRIHRVHAGFRASDAQKLEAEVRQLLN